VVLWLLLLSAAARPQWLGEPLPIAASGRDLLVAVDVSGSMDFPDMQWQDEDVSRLNLVQHLLGDFLESREGDRVGLILFGSQAYLQAPLTFDRHTVRTWLDEARIGIAGKNTAIGDAIGLALKRLRQRPAQSRVLILVTDGANNRADRPADRRAPGRQRRVKIYPIGIGADPEHSGSPACWASTRAWTSTNRRSRPLPRPPAANTSVPATASCKRSRTPSTNLNRSNSNRPRPARPRRCTVAPGLALLLSMLLVIQERWPNNALQRLFTKEIFCKPHLNGASASSACVCGGVDDRPLAALVPPLVAAAAAAARLAAVATLAPAKRAGRWQMILPPAFHAVLLSGGNGRESKLPWVALGMAWLLAVLALLGPSWQRVEQTSQKPADPLVVCWN
jgi:Ca-activated chloride channel family protein